MALSGEFRTADTLCGEASGTLIWPIEYGLSGSQFAAVRVEDIFPEFLPQVFPYRCDRLP